MLAVIDISMTLNEGGDMVDVYQTLFYNRLLVGCQRHDVECESSLNIILIHHCSIFRKNHQIKIPDFVNDIKRAVKTLHFFKQAVIKMSPANGYCSCGINNKY
jgi:hypothetical protein